MKDGQQNRGSNRPEHRIDGGLEAGEDRGVEASEGTEGVESAPRDGIDAAKGLVRIITTGKDKVLDGTPIQSRVSRFQKRRDSGHVRRGHRSATKRTVGVPPGCAQNLVARGSEMNSPSPEVREIRQI